MPCKGCENECKCTKEKCSENCQCDSPGKCGCNESKPKQAADGCCCKKGEAAIKHSPGTKDTKN